MNGAYTDLGTLYVNLKLKDDATSGLKKASSNIEKIGKSAKEVGNTFSKYITAPLTGLGALAIKEFAGFESSMAKVKAITQATSDEMAILTAKARDLGKNTQFSATEVADAMTYMGMAGWNTTQIMDGLEGVLDLAVASETDLAKVSDIVTDALTGFGMEAKDTQAFVDLLASVSRNANTDVNMLGESFKYVAPIMGGLGVSAEDTAYTLGLMANAGIKGSQAGTSLRQTMLSLVDPTKEAQKLMDQYGLAIVEAEDGSVDLRATLDNLKDGLSGLSEVQQEQVLSTIVGKEASSGLMAVLNAAETDVNKLTDATSDYNGVAKEMAKTMGDTTKGNVNKLKSAFSELLLTVGEELVPIFTKFVEKLTDLVSWFGSLDEGTQDFIVKLGLVAAAAGPVLSTVGGIASGVSGLVGAFGKAGGAAQTFGGTIGGIGTAIGGGGGLLSSLGTLASSLTGPVGLALVGATAGFAAFNKYAKETAVLSFDETVHNIAGISDATADMVVEVSGKWDELKNLQVDFAESTEVVSQENFNALYTQTEEYFNNAIGLVNQKYDDQIADAQAFGEELNFQEQEMANQAQAILEQQKTDETATLEELKNEALTIIQQMMDGTIEDRQAGIDRLKEINEEAKAQEIESEISSQAELDALKQNGYKLEQSRLAEHASEVITKAKEVAQEQINAAQTEYDERVRVAESIRATNSELADDLIEAAETAKNEKIRVAQEEHVGLLENLSKTYPELSRIVDLETGKQKNSWQQALADIYTDNNKEINKVKEDYGMLSTDVEDSAKRMALGLNSQMGPAWGDINKAIEDSKNKSKDAGKGLEEMSSTAAGALKSPYDSVRNLDKALDDLPTKKTIDITINERTRKYTQTMGSSSNSNGRSSDLSRSIYDLYDNGIAPLYDLPATLASGFTGDAGRENIGQEDNKLNKLVEELSDKLSKLIDAVGQEKVGNVYLDKRDLVGSIKYEMSKALVKKGV